MPRLLKIVTNKYIITAIAFLLLMLFFDQNDWFTQHNRQKELEAVQHKIDFLHSEVGRMNNELHELQHNPGRLERVAREKYHEKRDGEDVYLIIKDTIPEAEQE